MTTRIPGDHGTLNPRLEEVRAALASDECKTACAGKSAVEQAVWLVDTKKFRIPDVALVLELSPNVVRSAIGAVHEGRKIGHVGRPRTLRDSSENELCKLIIEAHENGHTLTRPQCLEIANSIYEKQLNKDREAGRINPEKELSWVGSIPKLSPSFMGGFLNRHPTLPIKSAHGPSIIKGGEEASTSSAAAEE